MFHHLVNGYKNAITAHPKMVLLLVILMVIAVSPGLFQVKLDASSDSLTLEHDHDLDYFREVNKRYKSGDFLVVTFRPNAPLFSDDALALMQRLEADLETIPGVRDILSMLDAPLLYSPKIALSELDGARTLLMPGVDREAAKQEFLTSPIYKNLILGPDGQTTALMLNLKVDERYIDLVRQRDALRLEKHQQGLSTEQEIKLQLVTQEFSEYSLQATRLSHERVQRVRDIVAKYKGEAEIFVGGATMITADMISFIRSDLQVFGVGVLAFMIVIMAVIFRQPRFVLLPVMTCGASVIIMLGFLGYVDWRLTVISSNFVALLLIISLAITIHLVVRYREYHVSEPEASQAELVWKTVAFMAKPCLYTTLTTMVAFVSLVVSDIRPVIDFGWMMTIGLGLSLILSFLIIPAGLMVLPKGQVEEKEDRSHLFTSIFSRFTERHPTGVLVASVAAAIAGGYGAAQLQVENRFIDYFHKSTEIYQGMSVIDRNLGGTISLDILLDAPKNWQEKSSVSEEVPVDSPFADDFGTDDPFAAGDGDYGDDPLGEGDPFGEDPSAVDDGYWFTMEGLEEVKRLHDYLDSLPEVGKVQSLAIAYQVGGDVSGGSLNNFELALMKKSLPDDVKNVLITPYLSEENHQTRITLRVMETSPELKRAELLKKIRQHAVEELGFDADRVHMSGLLVLYNNMLQSLFSSQIMTLGAVFVGILFMFVVLFRSLTLAVIAIVPNLLAALCVLGGMGLAGIPLDMMTITIAAITVGIGVDDTIHYIHRFRAEFARDGDYIAAMHRSHGSIGRAMFYTSVIIIFGFSILTLSEFIPTIYFGLLTGAAMLAAILAALTLLPRLILLVKPLGNPNRG